MPREFTSLYVHVPFCQARCDYCAFYSIPGAPPEARQAYLAGIDRELTDHAPQCASLDSVYVGGGTPSALTEDELEALLGTVRERMQLKPDAEFTVECNPESLGRGKAEVLAAHGVNRVSMGVQSFDPELRQTIGRSGGLDGLDDQLGALHEHGIGNIGMDLIYAIPGQTLDQWRTDLRRVCAGGVSHVSTYELTVHEGTVLACRKLPRPGDDLSVNMWRVAAEEAGRAGFRRYEVSNLSRPGRECRHNADIWHGATYLGVGPAASSFDGETRWTNVEDLHGWLDGAEPDPDPLPPPKRAGELLGVGLRTVRGWNRDEFLSRVGIDFMRLRGAELRELADQGLLVLTDDAVRPTERGLLFADMVARRLL